MKYLIAVSLLVTLSHCTVSMNNDFLQGFETGIFLRVAKDLDEYQCPEARPEGPLGNLKDFIGPLRMMGGFV